jgi:hypothetical protein
LSATLPSGWQWAKLSKLIADAQSRFACGLRDPEGVIQLRMNNVDTRGNFIWDDYIRVPAEKEIIEQYKLFEDDVLFNNTNSTELVGKSALFKGFKEPVVMRHGRPYISYIVLADMIRAGMAGAVEDGLANVALCVAFFPV